MSIKLNPAVNVEIELAEGDTITVSYKDITGKKAKKLAKEYSSIDKARERLLRVERRITLSEKSLGALVNQGHSTKIINATKDLDILYDKQEQLEDDFDKIGGIDSYDVFSKGQFDVSVTCQDPKDKNRLVEWIEDNHSYFSFMRLVQEDVKTAKGK